MKWSNVKLILLRELRDQLRDRRTLFMIAVLPILLYPLMGMAFLQVAQFMREHPARIKVLGAANLPPQPVMFSETGFDQEIADNAGLFEIDFDSKTDIEDFDSIKNQARELLASGECDAVVFFPKDFSSELEAYRKGLTPTPPEPAILYNSAKDSSRISHDRLATILGRWRAQVVRQTLEEQKISTNAAAPFIIDNHDLSEESGRKAAIWSKVLPFILIIWALTGAFYPAIDLCAGEKERGTLETLLCSPAERNEIVLGKLITVMVFSAATSLLNLFSMVITSTFIISRITAGMPAGLLDFGTPPIETVGWLIIALIPLSALFSALSLALAAMARSSKEGQYYLMPLMLITMPLAMIPVMPSTEISLGNSLVPVTGVMLLLKSLMEGDFVVALKFVVPVLIVTLSCCMLAIRWAVHQFNEESVMFRENERFELGAWLFSLVRDRHDTPVAAEAVMCGIVLLLIRFFGGLVSPVPTSWNGFMISVVVIQVAFVLTPVLLMTVMLTRSTRKTLLLNSPSLSNILMAIMLAFFLHPAAIQFAQYLKSVYPLGPQTQAGLERIGELIGEAPLWQLLLVLALLPAICEEIAFRGFILSGLRKLGSRKMAIFGSSVFFGVMHGILQQSISATILGCLIGYLAVQSRSIFTCIVFHLVHNGLQLLSAVVFTGGYLSANSRLRSFVDFMDDGSFNYRPEIVIGSVIMTVLVLYWFRTLPFSPSDEERLQSTLDQQSARAQQLSY